MKKILLIIPAYNEEANIEKVVEEIKAYSDLEYIIINDGSNDSTLDICKRNNYKIINLPINLGLAGAFQTGMIYAYNNKYDYVVQFDGDGQHKVEFIYAMKEKIIKGYDIVIASRFLNNKKKLSLRMLGSFLISFAIKISTGKKINDPTSGMRMYDKKLIKEFAFNINYPPEPDTISYLIKQGIRVAEIPCTMRLRNAGESYLSPIVAIKYMSRMLISILFIQNFRKRKRE